MTISCGIYLFDNVRKLLLIGHVTNCGNQYSIPKGVFDSTDVSYFDAAKRELKEETSVDYDVLNVVYEKEFSMVKYEHSPKKLKSFLCAFDSAEVLETVCTSMFVNKNSGESLPEIDSFMWVTLEDAYNYLPPTQRHHLPTIESLIKNLK